MQEPNAETISTDSNSYENTEEEMVEEIDESTDGIEATDTTMEENEGRNDTNRNIVVDNRLDDITPEGDHGDNDEDTDDTVNQTVNRSGRITKPYYYAKHFPDTAHP